MKTLTICAALAALPGAALAQEAVTEMTGIDGTAMGTVAMTQTPNGVLLTLGITNLPEGGHSFHIHETGDCGDDFQAAGGHFDPDGAEHGFQNEAGPHAGDMPNIYADAEMEVNADMFTDRVSMAPDAPNTLFDEDGSAIIIHMEPDTYYADAEAGERIACGVIALEQ
ncbi:superoxide dismutase family protein [Limimaricola pyoseonensis]|uniref:Superoxide dismutase, Cu-Zn family n=1 Tax=Limimaricola pyoseonensis TaxID=521013 RepID=A0A1G7KXC6_9RHOB|nr:superoxide dismutase family protein [Limimaricola pyoseonensis]SDF41746.1 superoxide dismutase, Cu-Zn family [Limimaricola pyoseonensis]